MPLKPFDGDLDEAAVGALPATGKLKPFSGTLDQEDQTSRTLGQIAKDTGAAVMGGFANLGGAGVQIADVLTGGQIDALDSAREATQSAQEYWQQAKSPQLQEARHEVEAAMEGGVLPTLGALVTHPQAIADYAVESLPYLIPGGLAARGAHAARGAQLLARGATKEAAAAGAKRAATGAVIGTSGVLEGATAGADAYQDVISREEQALTASSPEYQELRAQGLSHEEAREKLAYQAGLTAQAISTPAAALMTGLTGAGRLEASVFNRGLGQATKDGILPAIGKEAVEEFGQESTNRLAQNIGVQTTADPNRSLGDKVLPSGAIGAVVGGIYGTGFGVLEGRVNPQQPPPLAPPPPPPGGLPSQIPPPPPRPFTDLSPEETQAALRGALPEMRARQAASANPILDLYQTAADRENSIPFDVGTETAAQADARIRNTAAASAQPGMPGVEFPSPLATESPTTEAQRLQALQTDRDIQRSAVEFEPSLESHKEAANRVKRTRADDAIAREVSARSFLAPDLTTSPGAAGETTLPPPPAGPAPSEPSAPSVPSGALPPETPTPPTSPPTPQEENLYQEAEERIGELRAWYNQLESSDKEAYRNGDLEPPTDLSGIQNIYVAEAIRSGWWDSASSLEGNLEDLRADEAGNRTLPQQTSGAGMPLQHLQDDELTQAVRLTERRLNELRGGATSQAPAQPAETPAPGVLPSGVQSLGDDDSATINDYLKVFNRELTPEEIERKPFELPWGDRDIGFLQRLFTGRNVELKSTLVATLPNPLTLDGKPLLIKDFMAQARKSGFEVELPTERHVRRQNLDVILHKMASGEDISTTERAAVERASRTFELDEREQHVYEDFRRANPIEATPAAPDGIIKALENQGQRDEKGEQGALPLQTGDEGKDDSQVERRTDLKRRQLVSDMSVEDMRRELLIDPLTGLGNRRAYDEAEKLPVQVSIDVDALKWINDNLGHESGDKLLASIGQALGRVTSDNAFHVSGDEFIVQAQTRAKARWMMESAEQFLKHSTITVELPDGTTITKTGLGFSYGIGKNLQDAEAGLREHKAERERQGLRVPRGGEPGGVARSSAKGEQDSGHQTAPPSITSSTEEAVAEPTQETPAPAGVPASEATPTPTPEIQGAPAWAKPVLPGGERLIGINSKGVPIYEDEKGDRHLKEGPRKTLKRGLHGGKIHDPEFDVTEYDWDHSTEAENRAANERAEAKLYQHQVGEQVEFGHGIQGEKKTGTITDRRISTSVSTTIDVSGSGVHRPERKYSVYYTIISPDRAEPYDYVSQDRIVGKAEASAVAKDEPKETTPTPTPTPPEKTQPAASQEVEKPKADEPITITREAGSYNDRRYSKPWIAKATLRDGKVTLEFGDYDGDDSGGTLSIKAAAGDVIRYGQKDNRGRGTEAAWAIVESDGSYSEVTEQAARDHLRAQAGPSKGPALTLEPLNDKSIIVKGDTYTHKDKLKALGARWNPYKSGWEFPKSSEGKIREALADLLGAPPEKSKAEEQTEEPKAQTKFEIGDYVEAIRDKDLFKASSYRVQHVNSFGAIKLDGMGAAHWDPQYFRLAEAQEEKAPAKDTQGPLNDAELEALFDEAASELREEQEKPKAPTPVPEATARKPQSDVVAKLLAGGRGAVLPDAKERTAASLAKEAAKLGVTGIDETLKGLVELFGGPRLKSFPAGFDQDTYAKAKPHFEAALRAFQEAGKTLKDLFKFLIQNFGESVKPYAIYFAKEQGLNSNARQEDTDVSTQPSQTDHDDRGGDEGQSASDVQGAKGKRGTGGRAGGQGQSRPGDTGRGGEQASDPSGEESEEGSAGADSGSKEGNKPGVGAGPRRRSGVSRGGRDGVGNYVAPEGSLTREGSWKAAAERNATILALVRKLEEEGRQATPEEQELLSKFVGWGASEIRNKLFPTYAFRGKEYRPEWAADGWKDIAKEVDALLSPEELETAKQSTQYAHYTSEAVIRSIWGGLTRLGFKGGKILEPGMGIGSFMMASPKDIASNSVYTGIEMDHLTASIAKQLLPQANVIAGDFVKQKLPDGFFDVAIGNPPFAQTKILDDPAYKKHRFSLHDYFFAKAIDKVRPGGLLVFVTSRYTMDKANDKARQYLAERADLVGAIRLPQTAFKQNAGTEVVTDVLFLRKRSPGEAPSSWAWMGLLEVKTEDGKKALVNEYFAKHPEMVLGHHALDRGMHHEDEYTVLPPDEDIEQVFEAAVKNLPEGIYQKAAGAAKEAATQATIERDFNPKHKKEGGLYLSDKGELMRVESGSGVPLASQEKISANDKVWLRDYVDLRDKLKQAQYDQLTEGDWEASLKALNKAYDAFVKKHGQLLEFSEHERTTKDKDGNEITAVSRRYKNKRLWSHDIEQSLLFALEKETEDGALEKGDFLKRRTIKKPARPEINSTQDALMVSLDERGRLDLAHIAELAKISQEEVIETLGDGIYMTPSGEWQMSDEYLSGDVVTKLEEAETAAGSDPAFKRNVKALEKAQPKPLEAANITVTLGANWVPAKYVTRFANDVLGIGGDITYEPVIGLWKVPGASGRSARNAASEWGTADRSPMEILDAVLNNRELKVMRTEDKKTYTDPQATAQVNELAKRMRQEFRGWIWQDSSRATNLVATYNHKYNNIAPRTFDGKHLTLPGLSLKYTLHDHQRRAIWRIVQTGNTYLAHAVGAGKTLEMIVSAMEQKRLGLIQKPMFAVPNHMLNQFASEFLHAYPMARILVADEENFATENRRRFVAQAALNDWDAVIITHSALGKLATKEETRKRIVNEMIAELQALVEELDGQENRITRSKIEQQIEQIRRRFGGKTDQDSKDQAVSFEDLGVDFLYVDEAHEFRKLDYATNRGKIKGIDPAGSQKALDLYIKTRWLGSQRPGRSHVFASGTPVTNTMAEIYTVMRYMDTEVLERDGIRSFDAWSAQFGEVVPNFEQNAAGRYEIVERFSKFVNVPELMSRVRTFMDVLTSSQLKHLIAIPDIKEGGPQNVVGPISERLKQYMDYELLPRIQKSREWKPSPQEPGNPDPLINIITDGRLSSIDMRFVDPHSPNDPNSKLNQMIDGIVDQYHKLNDVEFHDKDGKPENIKGATQIVFSAVGLGEQVAFTRGFDARRWIMQRLKEGGVPASEVAWMADYDSHAKKGALFKDMREGKKKILIGSPKNMGTGVNVQRRLKALHYLSPPWYPSDVEQPHGRIVRQGNQNKEIELFWYATKGTYDSTQWGMVARKGRFIEQALSGDNSVRTIEDVSEVSQYEMAAALASGDERSIQLAGLQADVERLERLKGAHATQQMQLMSDRRQLGWNIESTSTRIEKLKEALEFIGDDYFRSANTGVTVGDKESSGYSESGKAILEAITASKAFEWQPETKYAEKRVTLASINGKYPVIAVFKVEYNGRIRADLAVKVKRLERDFAEVYEASLATTDPTGLMSKATHAIQSIESDLYKAEGQLAEARRDLKAVESKIGAPYEFEGELAEKIAEAARLKAEMAGDGQAVPSDGAIGAIAEGQEIENAGEGDEAIERWEDEGGGVKYSRGGRDAPIAPKKPGPAGLSASKLREVLSRSRFGKWFGRLIDRGIITIVQRQSDLPAALRGVEASADAGTIRGIYHNGRIYLVAENLNEQNATSIALHEIFHESVENFLGPDRYRALMKRLDGIRKMGHKGEVGRFFQAALDSIPEGTPEADVLEELAAYSVERFIEARESLPKAILAWARDLIAAVRTALFRRYGVFASSLSEADISAMTVQALKARAKELTPKGGSDQFSFIAQFSQALGVSKEALQREYDAVKEVRDAEGRLLAPNGKPSHLNPRQWRLVRTPRFKAWFGDSKTVDENGEPQVMVHHGYLESGVFKNTQEQVEEGVVTGRPPKLFEHGLLGHWFSPLRKLAGGQESTGASGKNYGPNRVDAFLSIQNPLYANRSSGRNDPVTREQFAAIFRAFDGRLPHSLLGNAAHYGQLELATDTNTVTPQEADLIYDTMFAEKPFWAFHYPSRRAALKDGYTRRKADEPKRRWKWAELIADYTSGDTADAFYGVKYGDSDNLDLRRTLTEVIKSFGYDGYLAHDSGVAWVTFRSEQIKSVNNSGTFDPTNPDIRYSYAGLRAHGANLRGQAAAIDFERAGVPMEQIRQVTGWFRGMDKKWRFEIDDSGSRIKPKYEDAQTVGEALNHPKLFEQYPTLEKMKLEVIPMGTHINGGYDSVRGAIVINSKRSGWDFKRTLLHELQHVIQFLEGFARGGSPNNPEVREAARKLGLDVNDAKVLKDLYLHLGGEIEARSTVHRMDMTEEERRFFEPYSEEDRKYESILRFSRGGPELSTDDTAGSVTDSLVDRLDRRMAETTAIRTPDQQEHFLRTGELPREESWINRKLQALREALVDYQLPFKTWLDKHSHDDNAWKELKLVNGKLKTLSDRFDKSHVAALREQVRAVAKKVGLSPEQAVEYLGQWATLRHVPEANEHLRSKLERTRDEERGKVMAAITKFDEAMDGEPDFDRYRQLIGEAEGALARSDGKTLESTVEKINRILARRLVDAKVSISPSDAFEAAAALGQFDATQRGEEGDRAKMAGGRTDTEAEELMRIAESKIDRADLERFGDAVVAAFRDLKEQAIRSGYISPSQAEGLPDFEYYVALTGDPLDTMGIDIFGAGMNDTKILSRKGRESIPDNAFLALLERAGRTLVYEATSDFKKALDALYTQAEEEVRAELGEDATAPAIKKAVFEKIGLSKSRKIPDKNEDLSKAVLWRDPEGKEWLFRFDDPAVTDALHKENIERVDNVILRGMSAMTRAFARTVTHFVPIFGPVNSLRDIQEKSVLIRSRGIKDRDGNAIDPNALTKKVWGYYLDFNTVRAAIRAAFDSSHLGVDAAGQSAQRLIELGGLSTFGQHLARTRKDSLAEIERLFGKRWFGLRRKLGQAADIMTNYNAAYEVASSFATFRALEELGVDPKEAAYQTLQLMNFSQKGAHTGFLRALYVFFNPAVQSGANIVGQLQTKRGQMDFAMLTLLGIGLYALAKATGDDDEELGNEIDQRGTYEISRNMTFKVTDGVFGKIPVGFGMPQLTWTLAGALSRWMSGRYDGLDVMTQTGGAFGKQFVPVGYSEVPVLEAPFSWFVKTFTPTLGRPIMDIATDTNAFGTSLSPWYPNPNRFHSEQGRVRTEELYKEMAGWLRENLGVDPYPEQVKALAEGYIIGPFGEILRAIHRDDTAEKGEKPEPYSTVPLAGMLGAGRFVAGERHYLETKYYELIEEGEALNRKHKSREPLTSQERRKLGIYRMLGQAVQKTNERRNKLFRSASDRNIPLSSITDRLTQAQAQKDKLMREALKRWQAVSGS